MPAPVSATGGTDATSVSIQTAHDDMIHDCQLDFYGKRLATCSSDRTVKIFDVIGGSAAGNSGYTLVDTLRGHEGPVWQVAWAHPKFGAILASCSYDGKVFVWREGESGAPSSSYNSQHSHTSWSKIKEHMLHTASVNSLSWAPHELGPILACASSDGKVSVLTFNNDGTWDASLFSAHQIGCNAVSWAPGTVPGSLIQPQGPGQQGQAQVTTVKRFASGGCDGLVKIWNWRDDTKAWECDEALEGHTDWVRDVAWAPNIGLPRSYLASAGQDKTVIIWTQDTPGASWSRVALDPTTATSVPLGSGPSGKFPDVVWRVSWSVTGNVLAVSGGDGRVSLWKENLKGKWECVSDLVA